MMRFMVFMRATKDTEAGHQAPTAEAMAAMEAYTNELIKAGVLLDGGGLMPSSQGARVKFSGGKRTVVDGPFAEAKELVAGYMVFQTKDLAECIEWVKRSPNVAPDGESEVEIRPMFLWDGGEMQPQQGSLT